MILSRRRTIGIVSAVVVLMALGFLIVYPGGRGIVGDYRLVQADSQTYELDDTTQPENQIGNSGAVVRIGWDSNNILVKRLASPTRGTPWSNDAGWSLIDVEHRKAPEVVTDAQIQQRADLSRITTYRSDSAYARGRWW
ncbi:MAG: hypothetical protein ABI408_06370 [Gemmatimonadaceae bacterium]